MQEISNKSGGSVPNDPDDSVTNKKEGTQTNEDMGDRRLIYKPKRKMICSFQNVLKIISRKKLFMECFGEKEPLGREEADGVSLTNDSGEQPPGCQLSFHYLQQKWSSN